MEPSLGLIICNTSGAESTRALFCEVVSPDDMLIAYFDESETQNAHARHFVVSGYVGRKRSWLEFAERWLLELTKDGFASHGIHWTDLAAGRGDFVSLAGSDRVADREAIQRRYLQIIKTSSIAGLFTAFDLAEFERIKPTLDKVRIDSKWPSPYHIAFELIVSRLCRRLQELELLEPNEAPCDIQACDGGRGSCRSRVAVQRCTRQEPRRPAARTWGPFAA